MRVFLDENMPQALRWVLGGHEVSFVENEGWKGKENGELLALVETFFDVILTSDGSIEYQNNLLGRALSMIVVPTNNLTLLRANAIAIRITLDELADLGHRAIITINWKGRRTVRRLDLDHVDRSDLDPVTPFSRRT